MSGTNLSVKLTILQGEGLVAKDRNVFGKKTSSDPFVEVWALNAQKVGQTKTQTKTLNPHFNQTFAMQLQQVGTNPFVALKIFDEDKLSAADAMGTVTVPIPTTTQSSLDTTQWYNVAANSAKNASGRLQVRLEVTVQLAQTLVRGNALVLTPQQHSIKVGLAWDVTNGKHVDLDVSCVALNRTGQVSMMDTVYYGNRANSNESVLHSGDEQEGDEEGDDESIVMNLDTVPNHVLAMYMILTVATPGMSIRDVTSTVLRVYDTKQYDLPLCTFTPGLDSSHNSTAMFMVRIARSDASGSCRTWKVSPLEDTHATARDFGALIPQLKSYTRDLLPSIHVNPAERVAIMRKGGNIRLADYCAGGTDATGKKRLPETLTFGLAWDVTNGVNIDLDASAVCLDKQLNLVDKVWFKQLRSEDGAILHHGDEREGDEIGDDEKMDLHLGRINPRTEYIGFVINSYSGQELDDVARAACHLFDPLTELDLASYAMTDSHALDKHTALVVACLYRSSIGDGVSEWNLCIISEPAQGRTVRDNVDELQNYLRRHPPSAMPVAAPVPVEEEEIVLDNFSMPAQVPLAPPTAPVVDPNKPPKKFVKINGIMKLNPEYKTWKETHR